MSKRVFKKRKGFSLAEAMMATIVLGIAAAGVLLPFTTGSKVRSEGMRLTLASKLAGDLMEEVVNTPFDQIVANYNYCEGEGQIKDASGAVFGDSNYFRFSREVSSELIYVAQQDGTKAPNFIKVAVRVYYDGAETAIINRLISN
jgi:prepilin-type N-terminal cleavage/methylation domain-containing protein